MDCIFCKIIAGEIPCHKVYEDKNILAFLDIAPVSPGHTLVIPKKHYENLEEIPEEELCGLMKAVKKIGKSIKKGLQVPAYNVSENNGKEAGQIVPHIHFHIIPRIKGDMLNTWPHKEYKESEAENILDKIKL